MYPQMSSPVGSQEPERYEWYVQTPELTMESYYRSNIIPVMVRQVDKGWTWLQDRRARRIERRAERAEADAVGKRAAAEAMEAFGWEVNGKRMPPRRGI
jgi:hypothetical protein